MTEFELKYGTNPNQKPARIFSSSANSLNRGSSPDMKLPIVIENGRPGYINFLDALNSWQLVRELRAATGLPSAASFKHVSPAGTAVGTELTPELKKSYFAEGFELSPLASAYVRARGADRLCSYGDWAALSDICDPETARILAAEVSDGVIAPGYTPEALEILRSKRGGGYNVVSIDPNYEPPEFEWKDVFGVRFEQPRNTLKIDETSFDNAVTVQNSLPDTARRDLLIAMITLKYTQSNSVCYVKDGQAIGVGAGQQSRVHCVRLAGNKTDSWYLRQHPRALSLPWRKGLSRPERDNAIDAFIGNAPDIFAGKGWKDFFSESVAPLSQYERAAWLSGLTGVALGSDAFFPFGDNIERARASGVKYIAQPGGSIRDDLVIKACDDCGIFMTFTGIRLFHH